MFATKQCRFDPCDRMMKNFTHQDAINFGYLMLLEDAGNYNVYSKIKGALAEIQGIFVERTGYFPMSNICLLIESFSDVERVKTDIRSSKAISQKDGLTDSLIGAIDDMCLQYSQLSSSDKPHTYGSRT